MYRSTGLIACLLLLSLAACQQNFSCANSVVPGIASGIVRLGVPVASVAQTSYSVSLTEFNLGTFAEVFSAFAIAGIQASSSQTYFSLIVDQVIFSNGNTQMNFTMNYNNPTGTFSTTWSSIKLSWLAVSTSFETVYGNPYGNYVWAGSVGMAAPFTNGIAGPVMTNSIWSQVPDAFHTAGDNRCGYINTSPPYYDLHCPTGTDTSNKFILHTYIMGFQFNPAGGSFTLAASALRNTGGNTRLDTDEALPQATLAAGTSSAFVIHQIGAASTPSLTGPIMLINQYGSQLAYIKIGIVITIVLDIDTYPGANAAKTFQYAGVYMNYTYYNNAQPIIQAASAAAGPLFSNRIDGQENYNYYTLLTPRYQIYGLSSFEIATLPANITVVNYEVSMPGSNTVLFQTDDVNYMTNVRISADLWANVPTKVCQPTTTIMRYITEKFVNTVPTKQNNQQTIWEDNSALGFTYFAKGSYATNAPAPLSSTVVFNSILRFEQITVGAAYKLDFRFSVQAVNGFYIPTGVGNSVTFTYSIRVEGNEILASSMTVTRTAAGATPDLDTFSGNVINHPLGYVFKTATPSIQITINLPRGRDDAQAIGVSPTVDLLDRTVKSHLEVTLYSLVYNPITDCCDTTCPANSGVSLGIGLNPPMCILCAQGLIYNDITRQCQCQTGFYAVTQAITNETTCFPCYAPLCQSCNVTNRTVCNSCVSGAAVNTQNICQCLTGFFQNATLCQACPVRCGTCVSSSVCLTCSDNTTRLFNDSCRCIDGTYDNNVAVCVACPSLCKTCSSATNCTSCFTQNNRALSNGLCVCKTGFFQVVAADGSLSCQPCDPSCTTCSLTADRCTDCDPATNRMLGYDALGNQVCNCIPGYFPNSNGQCVQSDCVADPYCSTCLTVLSTSQCIKCIAATQRVLVLPQQKCQCKDGFFDLQGICTPCSSGCAVCTSASVCTQCVASATRNQTTLGVCNCPDGYFFDTNPIRFCRRCANYTLTCLSLQQALTCQANFTLTNGVCTCPAGSFINAIGQCVPCLNGCQQCSSSTTCNACTIPLFLQGNECVSRCGPGYFQNGYVCTACSAGCAMCSGPNICLVCLSGQLSFNGFCYTNCPAGSVKANASACVECNAPCKTCTEHPSKCTSCQSCCGNLFNFKCLDICPVGTYAINGTCQYCAYNCKACLGSNTTCTACPEGKILFNGNCYDQCPYVMIGGVCTFNCANGLYKTAMNECKACASQCATCSGNPNNCTTCKSTFGFSHQGSCVKQCPVNYLAIDGECKACNPECKGCTVTCSQCIDCAIGYYKLGATCVKTCYPNMFVDNAANLCVSCSEKCKTCSSLTFCTTCANPQAVPVNGVCNDCSYPCNTCTSSPSSCTSCVAGFNLIGTTCIAACPTGAYPKNGVCVCSTGALFGNSCVNTCPTGHGNIGGQCQKCDDNCANCEVSKTNCIECMNGYALDQVSGLCQKAPSCQFGQYFSQSSNACTRICPSGTYFYENVCLTACLSGWYDNGVGGCVAATPQTGCSFPYFLSNGVCISNCPSGSYPDTQNRVCKACSSNCFSCLTNTFCYACNAGYDLSNGVCIAATLNCPSGQFRYNGVCYSTCPAGTCSQGNFCQRTCPAGTWAYNGGCYRNCPTKYTTSDACVDSCPSGYTLINGVCQVGSRACASGQYWDGTSSTCRTCQYPCTECSLTASYCTACSAGLTLSQNMCVSSSNNCGSGRYQTAGGCQNCPEKCATCLSATVCSSCASGYNFNGNDCVKAISQLKQLSLTVKSASKRGNTAFVTVCPSILPNGLSPQQQNNFFTVVPAAADKANVAYIQQWLSTVDNGCVTVAVNYNSFPAQSAVYIAVNAQLLANTYLSIGYSADSASSFVSATISTNLPAAPNSVAAPSNAAYTAATTGGADAITNSMMRSVFRDDDRL